MGEMVRRFAPDGYPVEPAPPRRGDRLVEPLHGEHERFELLDGKLMVISSPHDGPNEGPPLRAPEPAPAAAAPIQP
jgi:hypothetical protein